MMMKRWWMAMCLPACLLAACSQEMTDSPAAPDDSFLELNFSTIETRADLDASGSGSFSEGDRVGLLIDNGSKTEYRELTYTSGSWEPRLRRSDFGEGDLTLAAHFPVRTDPADTYDNASLTLAGDQSGDGFAASDLLTAQKNLPAGNNRADLLFSHALHRLRIEITGGTVSALQLRSRMNGRVNLLTGAVTPEDSFGWITPRKNTDGSYEAVIMPQEVEAFRGEEGLLKITTPEREIVYKAPTAADGAALEEFQAGKQLTLKLTLKKNEETEPSGPSEWADRTRWVYGVKAPDFPGEENLPTYGNFDKIPGGTWFRHNLEYDERQELTWEEGCGWYDCNKSPNYDEDDRNLCWAASASNLLIWWMNHNKAYIDAYNADYGTKVTSKDGTLSFEQPASTFLPLLTPDGNVNRAPVFEFFKSLFENKSGWNSAGVNWFITGNIGTLNTTSKMTGFPGFFAEVFQKTDVIAEDVNRFPSGQRFNDFINDALQNNKAIGINVIDFAGRGTGPHAMTIWGVKYDSAGIISEIYFCDNNSADWDRNGAVITRFLITYDSSDLTKAKPYMQRLPIKGQTSSTTFSIQCLCSVSLRQDIWARKYPAIQPGE